MAELILSSTIHLWNIRFYKNQVVQRNLECVIARLGPLQNFLDKSPQTHQILASEVIFVTVRCRQRPYNFDHLSGSIFITPTSQYFEQQVSPGGLWEGKPHWGLFTYRQDSPQSSVSDRIVWSTVVDHSSMFDRQENFVMKGSFSLDS